MSDYSGFILAAYGLSALGLVALVAWIVVDARTQRRRLERLSARRPAARPMSDGAA